MEDYKKSIINDLDYFVFKKDRLGVFRDAIEFNALNVAIHTTADKQQERIDRMKEILSAYGDNDDKKKFQNVCGNITEMLVGMLDNYGDHLGEIYMELSPKQKSSGQYFTPYCVSKLMAHLNIDELFQDEIPKKVVTFNDPCCGSGGMLVAVADVLNERKFNYTNDALFVANDIDRTCVYMCYLQTSFAGMPAVVKHQDTLTQECWDSFITPAYALQYPKFSRVYNNLSTPTM